MKEISALKARNRFGALIDEANKRQTRFLVRKRNKKAVVVLSAVDYLRLTVPRNSVVSQIQKEAKAKGLDRLTARQINQVIKDVRRAAQGHPRY